MQIPQLPFISVPKLGWLINNTLVQLTSPGDLPGAYYDVTFLNDM